MTKIDLSLYGLVDPAGAGGRDLAELAAAACRGGATLIQLRDKAAATRTLLDEARAIRAALQPASVPLLINDRVDVALAAGADGVHLGQADMPAQDARRLLGPDAIIGLTVKSDAHAEAAPCDVIDYVAIGGVFETLSKANPDAPVGVDGLARIAAALRRRRPGLPIAAIAGMTRARVPAVVRAGADGVAVISAVFGQPDVESAAREMRAAVDAALKQRDAA